VFFLYSADRIVKCNKKATGEHIEVEAMVEVPDDGCINVRNMLSIEEIK